MSHDFVVQAPPDPDRLILLFHGVGSSPAAMGPFGATLARGLPSALVVAVGAPQISDLGGGLQWFSVEGISESNRPGRVAAALPGFAQIIADWQTRSGLGPDRTVLAGFSQGAIMALAALALNPPVARDIVAVAGRFATLPDAAPLTSRVHLFHGVLDTVMSIHHAEQAAQRLGNLGLAVSFDRFPGVGHAAPPEVANRVVVRLLEADAAPPHS